MARFENGQAVEFTGRAGVVRGVIVRGRYVRSRRRASHYEYTVAPVNDPKGGRYWTVHEDALRPAKVEIKAEQAAAAVAAQQTVERDRIENTEGQKEERRCTLEDMGIKPGVTVLIRGRNSADWEAKVEKVDYRTGKFGIARNGEAVARAMARAQFMRSMGMGSAVREYRWISPTCVVRVVHTVNG